MQVNFNPNQVDFAQIIKEEQEYVKLLEFRIRTLTFCQPYFQEKLTYSEKRVEKKDLGITLSGKSQHDINMNDYFELVSQIYFMNKELYDLPLELRQKQIFIKTCEQRLESQTKQQEHLKKQATPIAIKKLISDARDLIDNKKLDPTMKKNLRNYVNYYPKLKESEVIDFYQTLFQVVSNSLNFLQR
jgi:hypothetical protein